MRRSRRSGKGAWGAKGGFFLSEQEPDFSPAGGCCPAGNVQWKEEGIDMPGPGSTPLLCKRRRADEDVALSLCLPPSSHPCTELREVSKLWRALACRTASANLAFDCMTKWSTTIPATTMAAMSQTKEERRIRKQGAGGQDLRRDF
eukprot:754673-Hanusia_phi.AAC.2